MKKLLYFLPILISFFYSDAILARVNNLSENSFQTINIQNQQCDEVRYSTIYSWSYFTLADRFINNSPNNIFLWNWKESRTWNFLLYNLTNTSHNWWESGLLVFNRSILSPNFLVTPGQDIRHLTTAEEYRNWNWETSSFDFWLWTRSTPFIDRDWRVFNNANIRNDWRHPLSPTSQPNFDDEVRIATYFDSDNNLISTNDNQLVVECQRFNVRWCWDWILDSANWEQCDLWAQNWQSWSTCNASCQPIGAACVAWTLSWSQSAQVTATSSWLCLPWQTVWNFTATVVWNRTNYTWSCNWLSWWSCNASFAAWWGGGWWGGGWWWGWGGGWWGGGGWWWGWGGGWWTPWIITNPWTRIIRIRTNPWTVRPIDDYKGIIWDRVSVFWLNDQIDLAPNTDAIDLSWATVEIVNDTNWIIIWSRIYKTFPAWTLVGVGESIELFNGSELGHFKWNTLAIPSWIFADTNTSVPYNFYVIINKASWWRITYWAINVRVSKPAISNIWWWSAYLFKPAGYSFSSINNDISPSWKFIETLRNWNFVASSINNWSNLDPEEKLWWIHTSYNWNLVSSANWLTDGQKQEFKNMTRNSFLDNSVIIETLLDFNSLFNLWQKSDIKIIGENWNLTINSSLSLSWKKTIILESWNLTINKDLTYTDKDSSWAFIVKNWNIKISKDVKKISGIFITLNWAIQSLNNETTPNQLVVDGWLYWDSSNLVDSRTYIRATNWYQSLSTWVIIKYSSRALKNPPPQLSNYISQFSLNRVAR